MEPADLRHSSLSGRSSARPAVAGVRRPRRPSAARGRRCAAQRDVGDRAAQVDVARRDCQLRLRAERRRRAVLVERVRARDARGDREHANRRLHVSRTRIASISCARDRSDATIEEVQGPSLRPKIGIVLAGGGSRGAYEAGIIRYLRTDLARRLGRHVPIDIVTGTSVGAINPAFLAATMQDPDAQAAQITSLWRALRIEELIGLRTRDVLRAIKMTLGGEPPPPAPGSFRYGGLLDTTGLERFVIRTIPWRGIGRNLRARTLHALSVSATHVGTGHTVVFLSSAEPHPKPLFIVGKALNALLLDHTEYDLMRMKRINLLLEAGHNAFGDRFEEMMNHELVRLRGAPLRRIQAVHIRPSEDIGALAAQFVASGRMKVDGLIARKLISRLAAGEAAHESDLLSYLLFDGDFAADLIELGRHDAAKKEDELAALFDVSSARAEVISSGA